MTPPDLAARVAALLDAGNPGHVRDLYEDLAGEVGEARAARAVWQALMGWRAGRVLAGPAAADDTLRQARLIGSELAGVMTDEVIRILRAGEAADGG
jgi:hypothetical protein